jgi:tetratricopeptide (TPR) repeat protein
MPLRGSGCILMSPQDRQVRIFDSREHQGTEPWAYNQALGGPNAGRYLHVDWPCEIYYKREFPCIDRSQPDFEDPQDMFNSYDSPEEASNLVVAELHNHDIVLSDRPSSTVDPGCYIKYEFQSAYLLRDPRPSRQDTTVGYRRFVTFVFGTVDHLEMTSVRPGGTGKRPHSKANAKTLMQAVQDQRALLQREEQIRQILEQADDAVTAGRYEDAIAYYTQAKKIDVENSVSLTARFERAQALKEQFQRVRTLSEQAAQARGRGDLTMAQMLLEQASQLGEKNTALCNAHSIILRDIRRREEEGIRIEDLLRCAREEYDARKYTEAIAQCAKRRRSTRRTVRCSSC